MKKKLAIIGASYLQEPLIQKAKTMGIETHVFAWQTGDVGERSADYFYPISTIEKEAILEKCKEIDIDGICSIASDLAMITVNYVAEKMGLVGNSIEATNKSTNKHLMRRAFEENNDPSPKSFIVDENIKTEDLKITYPAIVKPTDRSGSRGIFKINSDRELVEAIRKAAERSFEKKALVEEFVDGNEYSVEYISQNGVHNFLAVTKKFTTGAPNFIETGHIEPALINNEIKVKIQTVVEHALNSLGIKNGASHSEIKIDKEGNIRIIEIGGRMGGDLIGSNLVKLSTGVDFVEAVIKVAIGQSIDIKFTEGEFAAVRFIFSQKDIDVLNKMKLEYPEILKIEEVSATPDKEVTDSSNRYGYFLFSSKDLDTVKEFLPDDLN